MKSIKDPEALENGGYKKIKRTKNSVRKRYFPALFLILGFNHPKDEPCRRQRQRSDDQ